MLCTLALSCHLTNRARVASLTSVIASSNSPSSTAALSDLSVAINSSPVASSIALAPFLLSGKVLAPYLTAQLILPLSPIQNHSLTRLTTSAVIRSPVCLLV